MRLTRSSAVVVVALLFAAACSSSKKASSTSEPPRPPTTTIASTTTTRAGSNTTTGKPDLAAARVKLTTIVSGLDKPLDAVQRNADPALYVANQGGRVLAVLNGQVLRPPVVDIQKEVSTGNEQGLLGITFSRDGSLLYISYTDTSGDSHVQELPMHGRVADMSKRREILKVDQPFGNHNGGEVLLGPDNMLYFGLGDGGSEDDPNNVGQDKNTLLSKILRIDPRPNGSSQYSVPSDNPWVNTPNARPETWMWGLRNPWRFSFDRTTSDLWIGDVGQNKYEEIDLAPAGSKGLNFGWSRTEGFHAFRGARPADNRNPVLELSHSDGFCAVVGGYVYRGTKIPALRGAYLFSDDCDGTIYALVPGVTPARKQSLGIKADSVTSFGEDTAGELYVVSRAGTVYRIDPAS